MAHPVGTGPGVRRPLPKKKAKPPVNKTREANKALVQRSIDDAATQEANKALVQRGFDGQAQQHVIDAGPAAGTSIANVQNIVENDLAKEKQPLTNEGQGFQVQQPDIPLGQHGAITAQQPAQQEGPGFGERLKAFGSAVGGIASKAALPVAGSLLFPPAAPFIIAAALAHEGGKEAQKREKESTKQQALQNRNAVAQQINQAAGSTIVPEMEKLTPRAAQNPFIDPFLDLMKATGGLAFGGGGGGGGTQGVDLGAGPQVGIPGQGGGGGAAGLPQAFAGAAGGQQFPGVAPQGALGGGLAPGTSINQSFQLPSGIPGVQGSTVSISRKAIEAKLSPEQRVANMRASVAALQSTPEAAAESVNGMRGSVGGSNVQIDSIKLDEEGEFSSFTLKPISDDEDQQQVIDRISQAHAQGVPLLDAMEDEIAAGNYVSPDTYRNVVETPFQLKEARARQFIRDEPSLKRLNGAERDLLAAKMAMSELQLVPLNRQDDVRAPLQNLSEGLSDILAEAGITENFATPDEVGTAARILQARNLNDVQAEAEIKATVNNRFKILGASAPEGVSPLATPEQALAQSGQPLPGGQPQQPQQQQQLPPQQQGPQQLQDPTGLEELAAQANNLPLDLSGEVGKGIDALRGIGGQILELEAISREIFTRVDPSTIGRALDAGGNVIQAFLGTPEGELLRLYKKRRKTLLVAIAKGIQGEVGNLAKTDLENAEAAMPELGALPPGVDEAQTLMNFLKTDIARKMSILIDRATGTTGPELQALGARTERQARGQMTVQEFAESIQNLPKDTQQEIIERVMGAQ